MSEYFRQGLYMPHARGVAFLACVTSFSFYVQAKDSLIRAEPVSSNQQETKNPQRKMVLDASGQPVFDTNMLYGSRGFELANLNTLNQAVPGVQNVDVVFNGEKVASVDVEFKSFDGKVMPCISNKLLAGLNVDFEALPEMTQKTQEALELYGCAPLEKIISDAAADFDFGTLTLNISIPQAYLKRVPRGYVSPEFWDRGINAAVLNYRLGHYRTSGNFTSKSSYASIQGGVNYEGWVFRHFGYLNSNSGSGMPSQTSYDSINTYVERALPEIRANMTMGDSFTDGSFSNSIGIRGIKLSSSELMLPVSQRGYSPVVRGFAQTNAQVEVFQNGNLIYKTTVVPGAFVIDDLYQSSNNANYEVVVTESDGRKSSFIVPSSIAPQLIREDQLRYSAAFGRYRYAGETSKFNVSRLTAQYGFSNLFTGYSGITLANGYYSGLLGGAYGTDYGTFLGDLEFSRAKISDFSAVRTYTGSRLKIGYGNYFPSTQSGFDISAYSFNNNYWDLDSKASYEKSFASVNPLGFSRDRRRLQLNFSQSLSSWGSLYVMFSKSQFWNDRDSMLTAQVGYNKSFKVNNYSFGMSFNYQRSRANGFGDADRDRFTLTFNFPLGSPATSSVSTSVAHDRVRGNTQQVRFNSVVGDDRRLSYGMFAENIENQGASGGGNMQYNTRVALLDASVSRNSSNSQYSAAASGGVLLHSGGVTFANQMGETIGLVHAPGAKGALVRSGQGIEVDSSGYAIAPYLSPYQQNNILLDTGNVSTDVNFRSTTEQTIPYKNAVVLLKYQTVVGKSAIFDINRVDGTPPPFGSMISLPDGAEAGLVGQGGNSFVYGLKGNGILNVKWGDSAEQQCSVNYDLEKYAVGGNDYVYKRVRCE